MKTQSQCLSCMVSQVDSAMRFSDYDPEKMFAITCQMMDMIKDSDPNQPPAYNSTLSLKKTYSLIGSDDPYKSMKTLSNQEAQAHYDDLAPIVKNADDPLEKSFRASVAGNIIDMGISDDYDIKGELLLSFNTGFAHNDYPIFLKKLEKSDSVLILADNSGEIVFDKLLVHQLTVLGKRVIYMVKGEPLLNDATMEDAVETGMTQIAEVVTTGAKNIGFHRELVSAGALEWFDTTPLIIAKGMANFETLCAQPEAKGKTFCILKAKCELVAQEAGVKLNDLVFKAL